MNAFPLKAGSTEEDIRNILAYLQVQSANPPPLRGRTGIMEVWARTTQVPDQALVCNGQAVGRTQYLALFTLVGTTYGVGNGTTTFNVPTATAPAVGSAWIIWV